MSSGAFEGAGRGLAEQEAEGGVRARLAAAAACSSLRSAGAVSLGLEDSTGVGEVDWSVEVEGDNDIEGTAVGLSTRILFFAGSSALMLSLKSSGSR